MMRTALLGSASVFSPARTGGQTKRPLAIEDYYRVLSITNPQIAPDGKSVRFSVTTRVESDNSTKTEIVRRPDRRLLAAVEGRRRRRRTWGARRRTRGRRRDVTSPDGKWR